MKQVVLNGKLRVTGKKSDNKNLRKGGEVPCVLYGNGVENVIFTVNAKELKTITHTPNSFIINLNIDGKTYLAILHDQQYHPVSDEAVHVDFLSISQDKPVVINIPISITGNSEGVKQGGKLVVESRKVRVSGLMDKLPDIIPIDISSLLIGKQITAGDIHIDGINIVTPKVTVICSVRTTRAVVEDATTSPATTPAE